MTISHILAVLSSSDLVIDIKIIEMNIEPTTQTLRAKAILKNRTFPFHLHISGKDKPIECGEVFVNDILLGVKEFLE